MKLKNIAGMMTGLMIMLLMTSFISNTAPVKFSPAGTWEYSVPGVPEGYDRGFMVITEDEEGLLVSIGPSEDYLAPAQDVEFKKKSLSFKVVVEYEEVVVSGEFDGDQFSGTVSYVEGIFDITAQKKTE